MKVKKYWYYFLILFFVAMAGYHAYREIIKRMANKTIMNKPWDGEQSLTMPHANNYGQGPGILYKGRP